MIMQVTPEPSSAALSALRISASRRRIIKENGSPVFLLSDAAWQLFYRANRADAKLYLADRAAKGFNVVQVVALAKVGGELAPNFFGDLPLHDLSPERPNESYFEHVDWIVDQASRHGLYTAIVPFAGDGWYRDAGSKSGIFTEMDARAFGEWLGRRYRRRSVIWVIGGGLAAEGKERCAIVRAMARGLRNGGGGVHLMSIRSNAESGSSDLSQEDDWLDFESRRCVATGFGNSSPRSRPQVGPATVPKKPFLEFEPAYEDLPLERQGEGLCYSNAADARQAFYRNVFSGACGHCYGHHSVGRFHEGQRLSRLDPIMDWREALLQPGAYHVGIGRRLMESRPMEDSQPDDSIIVASPFSPENEASRLAGLRDRKGTWAMVYVPEGRPCDVRLDCIPASSVKAWRFDPRTGAAVGLGVFPSFGMQRFAPPVRGERLDWILVLDDASCERSAPGAERTTC